MYNKLFTKILDSSIWLESKPTRLVWVTFIAVMDEDGFAQFATVENVARRANVTLAEAQKAIDALEGPDEHSSDPDHEGRRLERVPGGWLVLNAQKYRDLVTRAVKREQTAERVRRHRARRNALSNASVTPSVSVSEAVSEEKSEERSEREIPLAREPATAKSSDERLTAQAHGGSLIPRGTVLRQGASPGRPPVPHDQHEKFLSRLSPPLSDAEAEAELHAFYARVRAEWAGRDVRPASDWKFWDARYDEWKPDTGRTDGRLTARGEKNLAIAERWAKS